MKNYINIHIVSLFSTLCILFFAQGLSAQGTFEIPQNNRIVYNLNYDWKFIRSDISGAQNPGYGDASWKTVSLPHTYNDVDLFDTWVTGSGNYGWAGKTWYRKHFKLDAALTGRKVMVEFEGIRQAGEFYINGTWIGRHENGVGPCGIDISEYVNFGNEENVLAVKVDNTLGYKEIETGTTFQWNTPPFNPNYGGIVSNVKMYVTDRIYQTLPLYSNMKTSGTYVYASNINLAGKTSDIVIESEVKNTYDGSKTIDFIVSIVDKDGTKVAEGKTSGNAFQASETKKLTTKLALSNVKFWSPDYPNMYKVYTQLVEGNNVLDVCETPLGIRKLEFNGAQGLTINGRFLYLKGYAPRTTMEWVTVGMAPDWLGEYDFYLMKETNGNFIRPMHCGPKQREVEAADKFGVIYACPAGDAEGDGQGRQWEHRLEVMRDLTVYFRNNPSVVFWEGGNQHISPEHMQQMLDIRKEWDPYGGRFSGTRSIDKDLAGIAEYGSTMDGVGGSSTIPVWDAEYARAESPRRVWDKYSPPSFGYKNIADPINKIVEYPENDFRLNSSEDLALNNVRKYYDRWSRRGGQGLKEIMVGGAKIIFADGCSHGRMEKTELARVSGVADAARLPKESFYALKAAQSDSVEMHIVGHWSYPAGTIKTMYVVSNTDEVSLAVYNEQGNLVKDYGKGTRANQFEFSFPNVTWLRGKIVATGYKNGIAVKQKEIVSAGEPKKLKLTPITGPAGFIADGSDIALFDVEVVDEDGIRVPTDQRKVDFTYSGQGTYLGGYNSGVEYSIFKDDLLTECGINRVFVRASRTAGDFTLNVTSDGLEPASATVTSQAFDLIDGLTIQAPQGYSVNPGDPPVRAEFRFQSVTDAELNTEITSQITTVMGLTDAKTIRIVAQSPLASASYSINGAAFTANESPITNGDQIRVKMKSDTQYLTSRFVRIEIDGVEEVFTVTTKKEPPVSTLPNLALNRPVTASSQQAENAIEKINDGNATSTRWAASGGGYPQHFIVELEDVYNVARIEMIPYGGRDFRFTVEGSEDGLDYFMLSDQRENTIGGTIIPVDFEAKAAKFIKVTVIGAATYTGNWVSIYEFRAFEAPLNTVPDQFYIVPQTDIELFSLVTSEPFTVTGLETKSEISLDEATEVASYSVNDGLFMSDPSYVENNDVVRVKLGTGSQYNTTYSVKVLIGGVSDYFRVTTVAPSNLDKTSSDKDLTVYPNPTSGPVTIQNLQVDCADIEIYTVSGLSVRKFKLASGSGQIDLAGLAPGMYLMKYVIDARVFYRQIILR